MYQYHRRIKPVNLFETVGILVYRLRGISYYNFLVMLLSLYTISKRNYVHGYLKIMKKLNLSKYLSIKKKVINTKLNAQKISREIQLHDPDLFVIFL